MSKVLEKFCVIFEMKTTVLRLQIWPHSFTFFSNSFLGFLFRIIHIL